MAEKPKPEPDDKKQSKRFIDTARELEVDESANKFEKAFKSIRHRFDERNDVSKKNSET